MSKATNYDNMNLMMKGLMDNAPHWITALSNASALIWQELDDINWAGFYFMEAGRLVLGPFQGKVACVEIKLGRGVCGTAAETDSTQLVENVHEFPGHIACDCASNSEIVVPLHNPDGTLFGVLDIDSPSLSRFTEEDKKGLEETARVIEAAFSV